MPGAPGSHPSACNARASPQVRAWRCWRPSVKVMVPGRVAKPKPTSPPLVRNACTVGENGSRVEEFLGTLQRHGEARHTAGFRGLTDARSLRDRASALAPAPLGGQLGGTHADLAEMLFVRSHGGDRGPLACLQPVPGYRDRRRSIHEARRVRPGRQEREAPPLGTLLAPGRASRRVRVHLLYDARSGHRIEGGTARGSGSP